MLKANNIVKWDKYAKIELIFFICIKIVLPLLTDIEYNIREEPHKLQNGSYTTDIIRRLVWGAFMIVPFYAFYKLSIQKLLVKKKYLYFFLSVCLFIVVLELYMVYGMYWTISKSGFLPEAMIKESARLVKIRQFHFGLTYLVLQMLEMIALAYYIDYDKQAKKINELQRIQMEADLQYLKAQLQPHFFFNTLNNIYSLALQRSELTAPLVAKLSSMMRYVLYESSKKEPTLQQECEFLENYMDVQSVRYNRKIDIDFETQGIHRDVTMEPLLLFPFIENAFKHGIEEEEGSGFIRVVLCLLDNEVTLSVRNSKTASTNDPSHKKGIGIANTQKRLALLYPGKHELTIRETTDEYSILLTISLD
jgi:sensor histidine kinase YesM